MDLQEALQQLVVLELNKAQAAAAPAPVITKAEEPKDEKKDAPVFDMDALVAKLSEALTPKVEALVEKSLPAAPERGEGTGRAVAQSDASATNEPKSIEELVAKAAQGHAGLSEDEKKAIWKLTHGLLTAGLSKDV